MTIEKAKELLPVIQAFAEGKQIQWYNASKNKWYDDTDPYFDSESKYRIKPKLRRMTCRQLAEWLAKGNGAALEVSGRLVFYTHAQISLTNETLEVPDGYKIRRWDSDEWVEPTTDIYEEDCK